MKRIIVLAGILTFSLSALAQDLNYRCYKTPRNSDGADIAELTITSEKNSEVASLKLFEKHILKNKLIEELTLDKVTRKKLTCGEGDCQVITMVGNGYEKVVLSQHAWAKDHLDIIIGEYGSQEMQSFKCDLAK